MPEHPPPSSYPVALVTGASSNLGRSIAEFLAGRGVDLALQSRRPKGLALTFGGPEFAAVRVELLGADFEDGSASRRLIDDVIEVYGRLDFLVVCAAARSAGKLSLEGDDGWSTAMNVGARQMFSLVQAAAPHLRETLGSVVCVSSTAASRPFGRGHPYVASKAAIEGMTRSLAIDLAPHVRLNAVAPGLIRDPLVDEQIELNIPLQRRGGPAEIARCVGFLLLDATYVTGQTLVVDGGLTVGLL